MKYLLLLAALSACTPWRPPATEQERANCCANIERNAQHNLKYAEPHSAEMGAIEVQSAEYSEICGCKQPPLHL